MKRIIVLTVFIFAVVSVFSQEHKEKDKALLSNGFYISPTQLIFPEIILTYEHFFNNKYSLSYTLGYKIPVGTGTKIEPFGSGSFAKYENQYMFNQFSKAVYFSVAPSYFLDNYRQYFIQCEIFNRFYWFDKKQLSYDNVEDGHRFNSIRSERNNVTGIKLLVGKNNKMSISKSLFVNMKIYAGIGLRYKNYHYENVNNLVKNPYDNTQTIIPYEEENGSEFIPTFHLGLKIGLAKKKI